MQSQTNRVISKFAYVFKRDDVFCLAHSLTFRCVYGAEFLPALHAEFQSPTEIDIVIKRLKARFGADLLRRVINDLSTAGLLVSDRSEDVDLYTQLFAKGMSTRQIQHMYFLPTSACNLRCRYCFIEDSSRPLRMRMMSEEVATKGLDVFAKLTQDADKISLAFYGGEPLLNKQVVYSAMRYVRQLEKKGGFGCPVNMSLLTNGSYVDGETVAVLRETGTSVSVSIDGPENLHNSARVDSRNRTTFNKTFAAYRLLQEAGLNPGVSCTLHSGNLNSIQEIVEFLIEELKPRGMGFNVLLPKFGENDLTEYSFDYAATQLIEAFIRLRDEGIYEDRVMRRVTPYINRRFHVKDCMGVGGQVVLAPDGKLGPCQAYLGIDSLFPFSVLELHEKLSRVSSETIYTDPIFKEWLHRFPLNMKECTNCFAIGVCGGGCPYSSDVSSGSIWEIDTRVCPQAKKIFEWMIWDTFEHLKGRERTTQLA